MVPLPTLERLIQFDNVISQSPLFGEFRETDEVFESIFNLVGP